MFTILLMLGGAYALYLTFRAGKRLGSQKGYAAGRLGQRRRNMR